MNRRSREAGFTLIELMVALVVSSLLVGMILAIFSRMSMAYRGQQQIAGVQQVLAAARAAIEADAKQVGLGMPQQFVTAFNANNPKFALQIRDNLWGDGPDQIAFMYADPSAQALVISMNPANGSNWLANPSVVVDATQAATFKDGDLAVLVTSDVNSQAGMNSGDPNIASFVTTGYGPPCAMRIRSPGGVSGTTISFDNTAPWGKAGFNQCRPIVSGTPTMLYRFVAHGYRIDHSTAARAALGPLQQSPYGGLFTEDATNPNLWTDIGYGFTDLQVAMQMYEPGTGDNADPDTSPDYNWYSGTAMTARTNWNDGIAVFPIAYPQSPIQLSISLVARTDRDVEGIATAQTPSLFDTSNPSNLNFNMIGNRTAVTLPSATDAALQGSRIYRYITFQVDLRNMGVGR